MEEKNSAFNEEENEEVVEETSSVENEDSNVESAAAELESEMEALKKEKDETFQRLLRLQAEFDNYKKRTQKEKEADRKYKSQDLVTELLPAIDNLERALEIEVTDQTKSLVDGITMVLRQFIEALKSQGVEVIETEGKEFDPNLHHAVMQVEDDSAPSNIVVEELQKGYILKDRVVRPAMVKVNK
ncbi:nucleotide exchange factor GrpE [Oceanobacillus piezotolerans]|uniref:Protein GrpE n=1 Tax=Oceanobacillus piezotolerans TaxID=2448030 RepID=A0A498D9N8_9BACI|nr:nucleotide exchange factor GrpE [Oceanobacillus piezotolerans]